MSADPEVLRDETFTMVKNALVAFDPTIKIYYQGKTNPSTPDDKDSWVRLSILHNPSGQGQASLAGTNGVRRWNRTGIVTGQCFAPLASGSVKRATEIAGVVRDALQGKQTPSCVWFRRPAISEIGEDDAWFNVNATIDFNYDELR